jgi:hypothetical protein
MFWLPFILCASAQGQVLSTNVSRLLKPDEGWVQFQFGQVGEPPFNYFHFAMGLMGRGENTDLLAAGFGHNGAGHHHFLPKCYLEVTDAYCPGDRLQVIRLNTSTSQGNPILLTTPPVAYNNETAQEICDGFPVQCSKFTLNPDVAYADPSWSSGRIELRDTEEYSIAIVPQLSPYCSGGGFVRIRCIQPPPRPHPHPKPEPGNICKVSQAGLHVVDEAVLGEDAGAVCLRKGMRLAQLTNENFIPATNVAFACSGAQSTTWIGAWNGQTWAGQEGLGLTVASVAGGGAINTFNDGKRRKVLCQE